MTDHPLTASVRRCSQTTTHHVIISCCHGPPDESLWQTALEMEHKRHFRILAWSATYMLEEMVMNNIVWLVGAVVIILAILSFFGLR